MTVFGIQSENVYELILIQGCHTIGNVLYLYLVEEGGVEEKGEEKRAN